MNEERRPHSGQSKLEAIGRAKGKAVNYSFVLRGFVRHRLGNVWGPRDRVKLFDLATPKVKSIRQQAAA